MKLAVMGDIHGNYTALETCLRYAAHAGAQGYIFLGDYVTDCPYPQRTVALIRGLMEKKPVWCVRGNREEYLLAHEANPDDGWREGSETGALLYTYQNLSKEDMDFFRAMPIYKKIAIPDCPPLAICHATPTNVNTLVYPGTRAADAVLKKSTDPLLLCAHTHLQYRYEAFGTRVVNPGSVGLPVNGIAKAQFALLTPMEDRWSANFVNMEYDRFAVIKQFQESGLNDMAHIWALAVRRTIETGHNFTNDCLEMAKSIAKSRNLSTLSEDVWEEAAMKLFF